MIHLTAEFHAKTECVLMLKQALEEMIMPTRSEKGCIRYQLFQNKNDSCHFLFQEQIIDQNSFNEHCNSNYFQVLLVTIDGFLMTEPKITFFEELGE
ncbi:antibiotic biosynthesis monooxygenase [Vibrio cholerae]